MVVAKGNKVSFLYHVFANFSCVSVNALEKEDPCVLWHKRPGHMSEKGDDYVSEEKSLERDERCAFEEVYRLPSWEAAQGCFQGSTSSQEARVIGLSAF